MNRRHNLITLIFGLIVGALGIAGVGATGYIVIDAFRVGEYAVVVAAIVAGLACGVIAYTGGLITAEAALTRKEHP